MHPDEVAVVSLLDRTTREDKTYTVVLQQGYVLGAYRLRNDGKLKKLRRLPERIELIGRVDPAYVPQISA